MRISVSFQNPDHYRVGTGQLGAFVTIEEAPDKNTLTVHVHTVGQAERFLHAATDLHHQMCMQVGEWQDAAAIKAHELAPWFYTPADITTLIRIAEDAATDGIIDAEEEIVRYIAEDGPQLTTDAALRSGVRVS